MNNKEVKRIVEKFSELNGTKFVGIREYEAKSSGEVANHVVNANFSYANAVEKDLAKLNALTDADIQAISKKSGVESAVVNEAVEALKTSFTKNKNDDTRSKQSQAQKDAYLPVTNSIKLNLETRNLHIYALAVSKEVLVEGEHKVVKSRPLTIAKNAVKKYCRFTTAKYRNFIVDESMLTGVSITG